MDARTSAGIKLADLVKASGAAYVRKLVAQVESDIKAREAKLDLNDPFRFFEEEDWYGYADAGRFEDGVRPVVGVIRVENVDGKGQETQVIIAAKEDKEGNATNAAVVEFIVYNEGAGVNELNEENEGTERTFQAEFTTYAGAVEAMKLLHETAVFHKIHRLQSAFGFTQIN